MKDNNTIITIIYVDYLDGFRPPEPLDCPIYAIRHIKTNEQTKQV